MSQRTVASATTSAVTAGNQVAFTLKSKDFVSGRPRVSVKGLATTETLTWWVRVGDTWEEVDDGSGTQVAFTATYASDIFNSPGEYGFTKDATASAIEVLVDNGQ